MNSFPGYKGTYLTASVKIMGAYDLPNEMQEARASSATILTHFAQNILVWDWDTHSVRGTVCKGTWDKSVDASEKKKKKKSGKC